MPLSGPEFFYAASTTLSPFLFLSRSHTLAITENMMPGEGEKEREREAERGKEREREGGREKERQFSS